MQEVTLMALAWMVLPTAFVQAPERQDQLSDRPVLAAGAVDYWGERKQTPMVKKSRSSPDVTVWAEPIRMPDGRFAVYVPPPQVLRFLDDPTPETARGYLEWQKERITKLRRAMEVLEATAEEDEARDGTGPPIMNAGEPSNGSPSVKATSSESKLKAPLTEMTYFRRDGCVFCDRQDPILEAVRSKRPDVAYRKVKPGESPELWAKYAVNVTPTVVIEIPGKPPVVLRGLASEETILKATQRRGTDAER
jgi:hypothetical protein